jgi:hypothetical protein
MVRPEAKRDGGTPLAEQDDLQSGSGRIARLRGLLLGQEDFCALLVRILGGCARTYKNHRP